MGTAAAHFFLQRGDGGVETVIAVNFCQVIFWAGNSGSLNQQLVFSIKTLEKKFILYD